MHSLHIVSNTLWTHKNFKTFALNAPIQKRCRPAGNWTKCFSLSSKYEDIAEEGPSTGPNKGARVLIKYFLCLDKEDHPQVGGGIISSYLSTKRTWRSLQLLQSTGSQNLMVQKQSKLQLNGMILSWSKSQKLPQLTGSIAKKLFAITSMLRSIGEEAMIRINAKRKKQTSS